MNMIRGKKIKKGREIAGTITFDNKMLIQWLKHKLGSHKWIGFLINLFNFDLKYLNLLFSFDSNPIESGLLLKKI
jgi:hypothetical protein